MSWCDLKGSSFFGGSIRLNTGAVPVTRRASREIREVPFFLQCWGLRSIFHCKQENHCISDEYDHFKNLVWSPVERFLPDEPDWFDRHQSRARWVANYLVVGHCEAKSLRKWSPRSVRLKVWYAERFYFWNKLVIKKLQVFFLLFSPFRIQVSVLLKNWIPRSQW